MSSHNTPLYYPLCRPSRSLGYISYGCTALFLSQAGRATNVPKLYLLASSAERKKMLMLRGFRRAALKLASPLISDVLNPGPTCKGHGKDSQGANCLCSRVP